MLHAGTKQSLYMGYINLDVYKIASGNNNKSLLYRYTLLCVDLTAFAQTCDRYSAYCQWRSDHNTHHCFANKKSSVPKT